jgi:hypothetical protein
MHAAGFRVDHARQLVGVGALQLGQRAVFEQQLGQRVVERQFGQHFFVGRRAAGGGFLLHRQAELAEQDFAQLLRRGEVERLASQFVSLGFQRHDLLADFVALPGEYFAVDQDAGALHLPDHLPGRQFDVVVDAAQTGFAGELRVQHVMHAQRHVGVFGGVGGGAFEVDLVEADLLGALAAQVFVGDGFEAEVARAQLAEIVALVGFDDVALQHRVVRDAFERNAVVGEDVLVVLGVLQHFLAVDRFQPGFQLGQHLVARQLVDDAGAVVGERDVAGFARRRPTARRRRCARRRNRGWWFRCLLRSTRRFRSFSARYRTLPR